MGGITADQAQISFLDWALSSAKSPWEVSQKGNLGFVFTCVYFKFLVWGWIPGKVTEMGIGACRGADRGQTKKQEGAEGERRPKESHKTDSADPWGCSDTEMDLHSGPNWSEGIGPCSLALRSSWVWPILSRRCASGEGPQQSWYLGRPADNSPSDLAFTSVLKRCLGGTGQNCSILFMYLFALLCVTWTGSSLFSRKDYAVKNCPSIHL